MRFSNFHSTATLIEGNNTLNFTYGPNQQRKKTELLQQGAVVKTTYFLPAYEEITQGNDTYKVHYVGSQAIYVQHNNQGELFYTYTDHLGSLLTLTDNTGNTIFEQNGVYPECNRRNAWGNHRNPQTWASAPFTGSGLPWLIRGFTGHEHLPEFALINMNGRTYDPLLGRMLSVDNFVQDATSTQGYNRYSYVRNNPLKYTDPSGEIIPLVIAGAAIIGGTFNVLTNLDNINNPTEFFASFGAGAVSGALATLGPLGALAGGALTGAVNSTIAQTGNGIGIGQINFNQVAFSSFVGGISGIAGAAGSKIGGRIGGTLINDIRVRSPLLQGLIKGSFGGAIGGAAGGFAGGFIGSGFNFDAGFSGASSGFRTGLVIGGATGTAAGITSARVRGQNPFTGKFTERSVRRVFNVPDNFKFAPTRNGDGIRFVDINNGNNQIRFSNGIKSASIANIKVQKNGRFFDITGSQLPQGSKANLPAVHLPIDKISFPWLNTVFQ